MNDTGWFGIALRTGVPVLLAVAVAVLLMAIFAVSDGAQGVAGIANALFRDYGVVLLAVILIAALACVGLYRAERQRVRLLEELRRARAELEASLHQHQVELHSAEAGLVEKERLAALGQITATVAHEFRNPLGTLSVSFSLIERKAQLAGLDLTKPFERIGRNIARLDSIITELLNFVREKGLEPKVTTMDEWLNQTLDSLPIPANIEVRRRVEAKNLELNIDQEWLRRAISNLVKNACEAMESEATDGHRGELDISMALNGDRLEIEISDNGPGIPDEIMPHIFELLFSTRRFGIGLGLPVVNQIMNAHGGGLDIGTNDDKGAHVLMWLPYAGQTDRKERENT